jgi:PleD family two-component response regulator
LLDRLMACIAQPIDLNRGMPAFVHVTIGVAVSQGVASDVESLLDQADEVMLRGKRSGKNQVWWS